MKAKYSNPVFCALDTTDLAHAQRLVRMLSGNIGGIKLGLEFYSAHGPVGVRAIGELGQPVFLDLKLHDIPNTVKSAVRALLPLKPAIMTVHLQGGSAMLEAAVEAAREGAENLGFERPKVVGVSVLTSLDQSDLKRMNVEKKLQDHVVDLAQMGLAAGLDGIVCSPREISVVRAACGNDFILVVPGVRPVNDSSDDQKRTLTPAEAYKAGADILVIGRPITMAEDPKAVVEEIVGSLSRI